MTSSSLPASTCASKKELNGLMTSTIGSFQMLNILVTILEFRRPNKKKAKLYSTHSLKTSSILKVTAKKKTSKRQLLKELLRLLIVSSSKKTKKHN